MSFINRVGSGKASASSFVDKYHLASMAFDGDEYTLWQSDGFKPWVPNFLNYDFGAGIKWEVRKIRIWPYVTTYESVGGYFPSRINNYSLKNFEFYGSNDNLTYDLFYSGQLSQAEGWQ